MLSTKVSNKQTNTQTHNILWNSRERPPKPSTCYIRCMKKTAVT